MTSLSSALDVQSCHWAVALVLSCQAVFSHWSLWLSCCAGRDVYVDIAGWHLYLRDMSAVPGVKMSQALATKLGPEVRHGSQIIRRQAGKRHQPCGGQLDRGGSLLVSS